MSPALNPGKSSLPFKRQIADVEAIAARTASEQEIEDAIRVVLRLTREHLAMDVAFVSHVENGERRFMVVEPDDGRQVIAENDAGPLHLSFCRFVVDGRMPQMVKEVSCLPDFASLPKTPFPVGAHLSTPIRLEDSSVFGAFFAFSFAPNDALVERDHKRLRMAAAMVGGLIDTERCRAQGRDTRWAR